MTRNDAIAHIRDMLTRYFEGDTPEVITYKVHKYLTTNNDKLGGKKPMGYLHIGNQQELVIFVAKQIARGEIDK